MNRTTLAKYVWEQKQRHNITSTRKWHIVKFVPSYSNITKSCIVCLHQKFEILTYSNQDGLLSKRSELVSKCCHINKYLLSNQIQQLSNYCPTSFKDQFTHFRPLFIEIGALNIYEINIFNILCLMFKCKNKACPKAFENLFTLKPKNIYQLKRNCTLLEPFYLMQIQPASTYMKYNSTQPKY